MLDSRPFLKEPSNIHDGSRYYATLAPGTLRFFVYCHLGPMATSRDGQA